MKKITLGLILFVMCFFVGNVNGRCADSMQTLHHNYDFNFKNSITQNKFSEVLAKAQASVRQSIQIAEVREYVHSRLGELTADGLIMMCEDSGELNLLNDAVQYWYAEAIERTNLTPEQEVCIAELGKFPYSRGLLLRTKLTADGLIAVCETPGDLNLQNEEVQNWFKEAIERTDLTTEQKNQIAESEIKEMGLF